MKISEVLILNKKQRYSCSTDIESIKCIKGIFWITYQNGKDIILTVGDNFNLLNKKAVIIQVLKPGKIYMEKKTKNNFFNFRFNKYKFQQVN